MLYWGFRTYNLEGDALPFNDYTDYVVPALWAGYYSSFVIQEPPYDASVFGFQSYTTNPPAFPNLDFGFQFYTDYHLNWPWATYAGPIPFNTALYYTTLLILQYVTLPKASQTVILDAYNAVMNLLPVQVENGFEIGTAVGVQLDVLGKYAGVTRNGFGPSGPITLDDADFTRLIQLAIIRNNSGSSLATIESLLATYFPGEIYVFDYANMHMSYFLNSSVGSLNLAYLFITEGLLPKPMGVQLAVTVYGPVVDRFFGMRSYILPQTFSEPINSYTSYNLTWPFLNYKDGLVV